MLVVKYHPNQFDLEARPKDDFSLAIVIGKSKKTLPVKKNDKDEVVETQEVDALDLMVLQPNGGTPFLMRKSVVHKDDHEDTAMRYKTSYFEELEADKELANKVQNLTETVAILNEELALLKSKINRGTGL